MSTTNEGYFSQQFALNLIRAASKKALDEVKGNTPESQLILGTFLGIVVAYPSVKIARAMSLFSGGIILALALKNKCECCLDLTPLCDFNFKHLIDLIKRNGTLSVGMTAGYMIGFAFV